MKDRLLKNLWLEKIKLTQRVIDLTYHLTSEQLDYRALFQDWSIRSNLMFIIFLDVSLELSLPISLNLSHIFRFKELTLEEVEKELENLSFGYNRPLVPSDLNEVYVSSAKSLDIKNQSSELNESFKKWKNSLEIIEDYLSQLNKSEEYSSRLLSIEGIHSIPAGIELYLFHTHKLMKDGIIRQLQDNSFPKGAMK